MRSAVACALVLGLAGSACAGVALHPVSLTKVALTRSDEPPAMRITRHVTFSIGGMHPDLDPGTRLAPVGRIDRGDVYRPVNSPMLVVIPRTDRGGGTNYEVYPVASNGTLVGFYVPTEEAFAASDSPMVLPWEEDR